MKLLEAFLSISNELTPMFSQERTARRAKRLLLSNLLCIGRHWLTRMLCVTNRDQRNWSADYRLFSRSPWKAQNLFEPVVRRSLEYADKDKVICLAGDETKFERAGRKVKRSRWMRDPLSPPFHTNFIKGIRIIQFTVLLPLHRIARVTARSAPVLFEPVESLLKPKKKAGKKEWAVYNKEKKKNTMCDQAGEHMRTLRKTYDAAGAFAYTLLFTLDGGFCNSKIFKAVLDRCLVLARCRKDANEMNIHKLIQAYVDRWEIEVNHRDEKQHLGVGDPQVWNDASVDRLPAFMVASYSFLLLASLTAYGAKRTDEYLQPPKWQRRRARPSCQELLALIRKEAIENPELLKSVDLSFEPIAACLKAAA